MGRKPACEKITCSDCKYHECEVVCSKGKQACDGVCSIKNEHRSCFRKTTCEFFEKWYVKDFIEEAF